MCRKHKEVKWKTNLLPRSISISLKVTGSCRQICRSHFRNVHIFYFGLFLFYCTSLTSTPTIIGVQFIYLFIISQQHLQSDQWPFTCIEQLFTVNQLDAFSVKETLFLVVEVFYSRRHGFIFLSGVYPATPHYNSWLLSDLTSDVHQLRLAEALDGKEVVRDVLILLKVWLHQRELDVVSLGLELEESSLIREWNKLSIYQQMVLELNLKVAEVCFGISCVQV